MDIQQRLGHPRHPDRARLRPVAGRVLPRAHLRAARHEGHRLQRAGGKARPPRAFYAADPANAQLNVFDEARGGRFTRPPALESGAGGLVSTADDLLAFGRMMLDKGRFGRERILSRPSVELMTTDHITPGQKAASPFFPGFWDRFGWGFGVAVGTRREDVSDVPGRYGWDGGYGTSWYVDPKEEMVGVLLTQRLWDPGFLAIRQDFGTAAYQAIDD